MKYAELKEILKADQERYANTARIHYILDPIPRMIRRYRWCRYLQSHKLMKPAYLVMRLLYRRSCRRCGCDIPSKAEIGPGLKIEHGWGIVINSDCKIGKNATILSGCVLGKTYHGTPILGDNVVLGAHAVVIGNVHIGDNAWIGAGAVVTHDVPENGVVYGESAKTQRIRSVE